MRPLIALAAALLIASPALASNDAPWIGVWDCEVGTFTFTAETYNPGEEVMPISRIEGSDGVYQFTFEDGYSIGIGILDDTTMSWLSGETGDGFTCKRLYR